MLNLHVYIFFCRRYLNLYDLDLPELGYKVEPGVRFPARAHTPGTCSVGATRDLPIVSPSSSGEDIGPSPRRPGFESPWRGGTLVDVHFSSIPLWLDVNRLCDFLSYDAKLSFL